MHFENPFNNDHSFTGYKILDVAITGMCFVAGEVFSGLHFVSDIAHVISWFAKNFSYMCGGIASLCVIFPPLKDIFMGWALMVINCVKRIF